jgi:lysophospholipase L1-like esterase
MWAPHSVLNLGIGGDGTQHVLWRLLAPRLKSLKPTNVLVILGTNNLGSAKACAISAGLTQVIERVAMLWPSAKIVFLEIPPRGPGFTFKNDDRLSVNASMRELRKLKTINADHAVACSWQQPCENYRADNLHFTEAGYRTLLAIIETALFGK